MGLRLPAQPRLPGIDAKVAFLRQREAYPTPSRSVTPRETHMSWVFLTDSEAWKLKKPVRSEYLDFSTEDARRRDSEIEVRLNRRLAPDVYRGVAPLTLTAAGRMEIAGEGEPIDWLIRMRRLPGDRMLDQMIGDGRAKVDHGRSIGRLLAGFYEREAPVAMTGVMYRKRLSDDIHASRRELRKKEYGLSGSLIESVARRLAKCVGQYAAMLNDRAAEGKIVEAHGDLRPEHICLESRPIIIDCLEFNRELRILDTVSEIAFLALECERLGAPEIGRAVMETYSAETRDRPPEPVMTFYRSYHAVLRAKVAIWHLKDDDIRDRGKWVDRARWYLQQALSADA